MAGMFLSGLVAYFMPLTKTYVQLLLCTSGFGLASGAYIGLTVALFADAFGNEMVCIMNETSSLRKIVSYSYLLTVDDLYDTFNKLQFLWA